MLGKTNALFVTGTESADAQLIQEAILTVSAANIEKIEYINEYYFAFLSDEKVLYGKDINNLAILKNGNADMLASHVIYADEKYYFVQSKEAITIYNDAIKESAIVYSTNDLVTFEEIVIKQGHGFIGLYKSSAGRIALLIYKKTETSGKTISKAYMLVLNTLQNYVEDDALMQIDMSYGWQVENYFNRKSIMVKDRIIIGETWGTTNEKTDAIISLDGTHTQADAQRTDYAHGYFFNIKSGMIYYSINGINYSLLGKIERSIKKIVEFENSVMGIFSIENEKYKFAIAESPEKLLEAMNNSTEVNIIGDILTGVESGGYTYIGCSGGVILKTYIDYSGTGNIPEVTVLKTLSAKQALERSKVYTEQKIAELKEYVDSLLINSSTEV